MKTIKLTCPSCEAKLKVDDGHDKIFCPYCGTEFLIDVKEISIGDKTNFEKGDTFRKSANVVIWYHTY